jgi:hypothetical protein
MKSIKQTNQQQPSNKSEQPLSSWTNIDYIKGQGGHEYLSKTSFPSIQAVHKKYVKNLKIYQQNLGPTKVLRISEAWEEFYFWMIDITSGSRQV